MLEQILDIEGLYLMIWQQLKISRKKSKKDKKAIRQSDARRSHQGDGAAENG